MLNFQELTLQNFLVFGAKQTIRFDKTGVRYIFGENLDIIANDEDAEEVDEKDVSSGSGKSTLPIGLLWVLYGEVKKKNKIPLTRIANKKYKKNVEGTVKFDIDGKELYWVKRYRAFKPHGNTVYLYRWDKKKKDWEDLSRADANETQEKINSIVGINYGTAMKAILFSRDDVQDFLDMPIADRFKIFENIIQLNKFKEKYEKVYKLKLDTEKELTKIDLEVSASNKAINMIVDYVAKEKKVVKDNINENAAQIGILNEKLFQIGDVDNVENDIAYLVKIYNQQISFASEFIELKNSKQSLSFLMGTNQSAELLAAISKLKKQLEEEPKKCLSCGEIQDKEHYNQHKFDLEAFLIDKEQAYEKAVNEAVEIEVKTKKIDKRLDEIKVILLDLNKKAGAINLKASVKKVIYNEVKQGKEVALQAETKSILNELNKLKQFKPDYSRAINYINDLRKEKKALRDITLVQKEKQRTLAICLIWMKVLDVREETSIKQIIISRIIPAFNSILQLNLDDIYNGLLRITFDSFLNEVMVYEGEEAQISELSTGERARINLCINLAAFELTRINLNASNAIFMDEVFNSMDVYSINKFIKMIKNRYAKDCLIHIVSHSKGVEENLEADEVIKIQRKDRESKIIFV